ncbi:MAG: heterodisulfide reductase-related iron-sulfur binding cluster [Steroidobacteraceae bacterium]
MSEARTDGSREGNLQAPVRHPLRWREASFYDETALEHELTRVFEICHGCRRCFNLCQSFPTLFDAIDESSTMELSGVDKRVYWKVVDNCYLCDLCFSTKCPYVPPHPWDVDFPHLMLRAKAVRARRERPRLRERVLTSTDAVGRLAGIPVVAEVVNAANRNAAARKLLDRALGVHPQAPLPAYHARSARRRLKVTLRRDISAQPTEHTRGQVALFTTCYGNRNEPHLAEDLAAVFEHNGIAVVLTARERCCGMPKLELGDFASIDKFKRTNAPELTRLISAGYDIVAPIPSCVLMFKQELPLMYPEDAQIQRIAEHIFDPFEYLMLRHKAGLLRTDFKTVLGKISYHVPCHLRVQNIGLKTRDVLRLVPDTSIEVIERCSGHNGTYAVKSEFRAASMKIGRPVFERVDNAGANYYSSDCPMAGHQIESGLARGPDGQGPAHAAPAHPMKLLRIAYGI